MTITIDELCERLRINHAIPEEQYPAHKRAPYDLQSKWYDYRSLSSTKAVAPIVCEQLQGVETAVELGAGTGFRVLYYAMNNPQTKFLAVDKDSNATNELKDRARKLRVPNLRVQTMDMYRLHEKYAAVIAIDCFGGQGHSPSLEQSRINLLRVASLVDSSKQGAFFCTTSYGPMNEASRSFMAEIFQEAGLPRLETVSFEFTQRGGEEWGGRVLFGKIG